MKAPESGGSDPIHGVGRQRLPGPGLAVLALLPLGAPLLEEFALPGQDHLGRDVADPTIADVGPDVVVRVLAVVEAGLEGEVLVGVDPVEVEIEKLVDLEAGRRRSELAPVDLGQDLPALTGGLGHGAETAPGDLVALPGQGILADGDLEVPLAPVSWYTPGGLAGMATPSDTC